MQLAQFLIGPETPIIDAMSSLDKLDEKILYVVSKDNVLLGAVTDGDIRRYILKKQSDFESSSAPRIPMRTQLRTALQVST